MPRVADLAAKTLYAHGVRHAFGMPGGEVVTFIDALENAGIRFILCRHETNAAIMAAGASVATGAPGLLVTTLGPGLTNAVNGIADASQEHVPLIAVSGVVEHNLRGRYTHQIIDQTTLMQPLVKGSFELEQQGTAATMARAIRLAQRGPMGPVFVQLSPDTAAKTAPDTENVIAAPKRLAAPVSADSEAVTEIARLVRSAQRPLIVAGLEAAQDRCGTVLQKLMDGFGIPLITTYKAKGIVDEHHSLALGGAGLSPLADKHLLPLVKAADLVLLVGYDPIEMRPGWLDPFAPAADVIEISATPAAPAVVGRCASECPTCCRLDEQETGSIRSVSRACAASICCFATARRARRRSWAIGYGARSMQPRSIGTATRSGSALAWASSSSGSSSPSQCSRPSTQ